MTSTGPRTWTTTRQIDAPPAAVWAAITDTHAWTGWGPSVQAVECTDRWIRAGSQGRVKALGLWLRFEIDAFEPGRRWSWRVAGLRATDHSVEGRDGGAALTFGVPWFAPPYLIVCAIAIRRVAARVERLAA